MAKSNRRKLIEQIEAKRGSKVYCLLTSDRIGLNIQLTKDILPVFVEHLRLGKPKDKIDVFVFTNGGDVLTGFGLSRLLREYVPWVGALVPAKCHSSGTLFALGANEVLMTKWATLSPIDPSVNGLLNPIPIGATIPMPLSVESVAGFKALVSEDWRLQGEDSLVAAFKILAEKVHPLALGDVFRTRQQIELLATKLLSQHRKDTDGISEIVNILTKKLGSHDYLIYRSEAREILGEQIVSDDETEDLIWELYLDFAKDMELGTSYNQAHTLQKITPNSNPLPSPITPGFLMRSARTQVQYFIIESALQSDVYEEAFELSEFVNAACDGTRIVYKPLSSEWKKA